MDSKKMYENLIDEISNEMKGLVKKFKEYVSNDHDNNPRCVYDGFNTRANYGVVESKPFWPPTIPLHNGGERKNYFYYLSEHVTYYNGRDLCYSNTIFYNDEIKAWFIYDKNLNDYTELSELNVEAQIAFVKQLEKLLN